MKTKQLAISVLTASALLGLASAAPAHGPSKQRFTDWSYAMAVMEINSDAGDGCPIESPDGLSIYIASTRPDTGAMGGNDIWAADRASNEDLFGPPEHLDAPVNSPANDFCPTPLDRRLLMFVSEREGPETCNAHPPTATTPGSGDIYIVRQNASGSWGVPQHLGCLETGTGPNSNGAEFSPSLVTLGNRTYLYFSSTVSGNMDIYVSRLGNDGVFGPPSPVHALNTEFDDRMPNVSADGLEVVFSSNRPVDAWGNSSFGGFDVYVSTRSSPWGRWSTPKNLGENVNKGGNETRSSLSRDMLRLYFGRDGDIYSSSREKKKHKRHR